MLQGGQLKWSGHLIRMPPGTSLRTCFGHVWLEGDPGADPKHACGTTYPSWSMNTSGSPKETCWIWLEKITSGLLSSICYNWNPVLNMNGRKRTDGWMIDRWMDEWMDGWLDGSQQPHVQAPHSDFLDAHTMATMVTSSGDKSHFQFTWGETSKQQAIISYFMWISLISSTSLQNWIVEEGKETN